MRREGNDSMFWTPILSGPIKTELGEYCRIFERGESKRTSAIVGGCDGINIASQ